jgi:NAD(P)H dehydrogenase (quinone)
MRAYVVHAHPEPRSFTAAMRDTIVAALRERGDEVSVADLYEIGFNPVLSRADFLDPQNPEALAYTAEQRAGYAGRTLAPDILAQAEAVLAADLLVLTFPVYWFSMPAMLKGWIDRVLLSGPMYSGRHMYAKGGLRGRRALVAASLGGRDHMFGEAALHGDLERGMLSHLLRGTLGVVGYDVVAPFWAYHAPYVDQAERERMLARLRRYVLDLERAPLLDMPDLASFDERFRPITGTP